MANVQIKSEKLTPFGGFFPIMEQFDALLAQTIDSTLGMRCKWYGYQYSEILRSLMCVYLCGGSCVEDVTTHLSLSDPSVLPQVALWGEGAFVSETFLLHKNMCDRMIVSRFASKKRTKS